MQDINKKADFLIKRFTNFNTKDNFKKIDDQKIKLLYYNLFFDSYPEMFSEKFNFTFVEDINIYLDNDTNTFMIYVDQNQNKRIIFETPHYSIINLNFPTNDWKILKTR